MAPAHAAAPGPSIRPGAQWLDTAGTPIDAHGAGLMLDTDGRIWWYGSQRQGHPCKLWNCRDGGINAYSSSDLYAWRFEGLVVPAFNDTNPRYTRNGLLLERPKVVRCTARRDYVMWVRGTAPRNEPQALAVLRADAPAGPWRLVRHFRHLGPRKLYQYADATLFQDPRDGATYVYWRTQVYPVRDRRLGFHAMRLSDDCADTVDGSDTQIFVSAHHEAPAVFFAPPSVARSAAGNNGDGTYYLWTGGTNGWRPAPVRLHRASSPLGAFNGSELAPPMPEPRMPGNAPPVQPGAWAFGSQCTFVLPNPAHTACVRRHAPRAAPAAPAAAAACARLPQFVYVADRWDTLKAHFGRYVWLPLYVDPLDASRVLVRWASEWRLDEECSPFVTPPDGSDPLAACGWHNSSVERLKVSPGARRRRDHEEGAARRCGAVCRRSCDPQKCGKKCCEWLARGAARRANRTLLAGLQRKRRSASSGRNR